MDSTKFIKIICAKEGLQYKDIAQILFEKTKKPCSYESFTGKLHRDSLRYTEAFIIADALGYDLELKKR